jgi:2-polyprenyl-3-methyl-5-hydroxy-6-metoxy-1,4-benzoquinol methylase
MEEREKYERMHAVPGYSPGPGASYVNLLINRYLWSGDRVIDFGCGTGDAAAKLQAAGYGVYLVDIAANAMHVEALRDRFYCCALHELPGDLPACEWGFCSDVMEHLPAGWIAPSLAAMRAKTGRCFFSISGVPDGWGRHIGEVLHLSVHPREWWIQEIGRHWREVESLNESDNTYLLIGRG